MLRLKFPVTMATRGHLKIAKNHYFTVIFSIKSSIGASLASRVRMRGGHVVFYL
jgi:hypothetical protein